MTPSPRELLAQALDAYGDIERHAHKAGVSPKDFLNAQTGRPCPTIPFLRICVAIQHDPLPSIPHQMPEKPSDFDFGFFSMAFRMKRTLEKDCPAAAALRMDIMPATITRIERGDRLLFGVVARAWRYIGIHPFGYLGVSILKKIETPPSFFSPSHVSRETCGRRVGQR